MTPLKFNDKGLIPVIIQDEKNGEVLMLAYMDKTALQRTLKEKKTVFYSRSRNKYWVKGDLGLWLLSQGWVRPDKLANEEYRRVSRAARCARRGLWRGSDPGISCRNSAQD